MTKPTHIPEEAFKPFALWLAALFLVVLGAKLWVVQLYGSPLPLWDQWYEADNFFRPWMAGHLTWGAFVAAHNEHRILCTRLLDLGVIQLNGRWEPLLQMTVNVFIYAAFACGLAFCLWKFLGRKHGWFICFLLAPFFALPYAGENTIWAFNSQVYFLNFCSLAALAGLGFDKPAGRWWWLGLAASILGLFTAASGLLAPVAVGGLVVLRAIKNRQMAMGSVITMGAYLAIAGLGLALRVNVESDRPLQAHSLGEFAAALLRNLDWPFFDAPWMAGLILLPLVLLLIQYLQPNFKESRSAEFLLVFGLWSGLQSAALAYGRANYGEAIPASRFMDELSFLVIASLFAIVLLPRTWVGGRFPGWAGMVLPLVFAVIIFSGLCRISNIVVDNLLAPTRMMNLMAEERVATFMTSGDERDLFETPTVRPDPKLTLSVLRDTKLQTILPAACLRPASPPVAGRPAAFSLWLLRHAVVILSCGLILFAGLCGYGLTRGAFGLARGNLAGIVAVLTGLAALGFVWSKYSVRRESVEKEMHHELAVYFKSADKPARAAFHERLAGESGQ